MHSQLNEIMGKKILAVIDYEATHNLKCEHKT
jgi:hypothetical protein